MKKVAETVWDLRPFVSGGVQLKAGFQVASLPR